ncbi:hypothetical protein AGMMS50256_13690 [Betaproteobacteria bacterium]|nr:hypothetical protein AGMMS50256_13690 [Betaproteobacteria bacterium]
MHNIKYGNNKRRFGMADSSLDFIVSYNFKHIVKRKTVLMTSAINLREGYKQMGIYSPSEVIENG